MLTQRGLRKYKNHAAASNNNFMVADLIQSEDLDYIVTDGFDDYLDTDNYIGDIVSDRYVDRHHY